MKKDIVYRSECSEFLILNGSILEISDEDINFKALHAFLGEYLEETGQKETNLEKAKRLYPKGTKFKDPETGEVFISKGLFREYIEGEIECDEMSWCFYEGEWADIVEEVKPNTYFCEHSKQTFERDEQGEFEAWVVSLKLWKRSKYKTSLNKYCIGRYENVYFHTEKEALEFIKAK